MALVIWTLVWSPEGCWIFCFNALFTMISKLCYFSSCLYIYTQATFSCITSNRELLRVFLCISITILSAGICLVFGSETVGKLVLPNICGILVTWYFTIFCYYLHYHIVCSHHIWMNICNLPYIDTPPFTGNQLEKRTAQKLMRWAAILVRSMIDQLLPSHCNVN